MYFVYACMWITSTYFVSPSLHNTQKLDITLSLSPDPSMASLLV